MLQQNTLRFLASLAENNNKPWFDENKQSFLAAKEDVEHLVADVLVLLAEEDSAFVNHKAKDCVMRIYRDVRFSKDKSPYKTNFGVGFMAGGRKAMGAGYYLHIQPGASFIGGGIWMPEGKLLKAIRQEIDYGFDDFRKIVEDKKFIKLFGDIEGERLQKLPKGYAEDNPAIHYLKLKSFTVGQSLADDTMTNKKVQKSILDAIQVMKPFVDFLNRAVE